jgi:16S rRNA (cytidine1402-2'-O)-methyltransferase
MSKLGTLYVVATPIGNLKDMTLRAIEILNQVDRVVVEDTRHSAPLLKHFSINKPMLAMHDFNERGKFQAVIEYLQQGERIALISDAGTPLISDPGFLLIREAKEQNISVVPIPGACAAVAALSVSGLPTDKFVFEGFLPAKQEARIKRLKLLCHENRTMVFYEAPHRLLDAIQDMGTVFGTARKSVLARELTKIHETVISSDLLELIKQCSIMPLKGEVVILVAGAVDEQLPGKEVIPEQVLSTLLEELPLKQAVSLASKITGVRKNQLYEIALMKKS